MARLLKIPQPGSAGLMTFTTAEHDQVLNTDASASAAATALKTQWIVGLDHNWHDHAFCYDPPFDCSMAGADDLIAVDSAEVPLAWLSAAAFPVTAAVSFARRRRLFRRAR
jgi:hypothetical protein